jgi:spermidine/putrescine transport system permease protein
VVRARLAGFDRSLEEAAMDLGAGPWRTFRMVTLPGIAPGILAAALLVFALSIDDYVVTSFVAGVGATTLPLQIYSMVRSGVSPAINAISTVLLLATALLLLGAYLLEQGRSLRAAILPAGLGLAILAAPFALARPATGSGDRVLNLYLWSNYITPEAVRGFEQRFLCRVNLDLYDSNEALLAKLQAANAGYDVVCPSNYPVQILLRQSLLRPLDLRALPHFANLDPRFVNLDFDPGNRYSVPYVWGTCGIAYSRRRAGRGEGAVRPDPGRHGPGGALVVRPTHDARYERRSSRCGRRTRRSAARRSPATPARLPPRAPASLRPRRSRLVIMPGLDH